MINSILLGKIIVLEYDSIRNLLELKILHNILRKDTEMQKSSNSIKSLCNFDRMICNLVK